MSSNPEKFFDRIDSARVSRVRELLEVKALLTPRELASDRFSTRSRAFVVLCYSVWEGFYEQCLGAYADFLRSEEIRIIDVNWKLLIGVLDDQFQSLYSRNNSFDARCEFVKSLERKIACDFSEFEWRSVKAKSNLSWEIISKNFAILDFDITPLRRYRTRIDRELVGWRNSVAHGDSPNLEQLDADRHVSLVEEIIIVVSDTFQEAILTHA